MYHHFTPIAENNQPATQEGSPHKPEPERIPTPEELLHQVERLELQAQQARALANVLDCEADRAISLAQFLRLEAQGLQAEGGAHYE